MRGFLDGETAKGTQLYDFGKFRVELFQAIERVIQREDGHLVGGGYAPGFVDRHTANTVAAFARGVTPGVIDEDPAHHLCRHTKEMRSILPIHLALVDQSHVRLVNQRCGLKGVIGAFVLQLARRNAAELRIYKWQQPVERSPFSRSEE